jgi:hypothetical protein
MDNKDDKRRQLIQTMLAQAGGDDRHVLPWRALAAHLSPLIGDSGFAALFGRTTRLLARDHGWLTIGNASPPLDALFRQL